MVDSGNRSDFPELISFVTVDNCCDRIELSLMRRIVQLRIGLMISRGILQVWSQNLIQ